MKLLITGGNGFIGGAVVRRAVGELGCEVVNVDKLSYAADPRAHDDLAENPRYVFEHADISDLGEMARIFRDHKPDAVMHLAAKIHVDRSIDGPAEFVSANIIGTYTLLELARAYWSGLDTAQQSRFRFLHVSTDEVYGALGASGRFTEESPHRPNSPYAATKASSDMLARAWGKTFGLPVLISNCSNNYGPRQFPEKLIPVVISKACAGEPIPVYGRGENVRDWLHVEDHARALFTILDKGRPGETYNVGGDNELTNLELVKSICAILDELRPADGHAPHEKLIEFVGDRPGHDFRYAIDAGKLEAETGWRPQVAFADGLKATVQWYLDNGAWLDQIRSRGFKGERIGVLPEGAA